MPCTYGPHLQIDRRQQGARTGGRKQPARVRWAQLRGKPLRRPTCVEQCVSRPVCLALPAARARPVERGEGRKMVKGERKKRKREQRSEGWLSRCATVWGCIEASLFHLGARAAAACSKPLRGTYAEWPASCSGLHLCCATREVRTERKKKKRKGKLPDLCVLTLTPCGVSKPSILT